MYLQENPLLQDAVRQANEQEDEDMKIAGQVGDIWTLIWEFPDGGFVAFCSALLF